MHDLSLIRAGGGAKYFALAIAIASLAASGCSSLPGFGPSPMSRNFEPDMYRDALKKQRAESLPKQMRTPTVKEKLREGDAARVAGDDLRAMWAYLHAYRLDRDDPEPIERIATLHLKRDPHRAEALFDEILRKHPHSREAYTGIGLARIAKGDLEGAQHFLKQALDLDPSWAPALSALAVVEDRLGNHAEAQARYRQALAIDRGNQEALNNLGVSYIATGDYAAAVETLREALLIEYQDPIVHNNLGLALGRMGRYAEAEEEFRLGGDEAAALNNLAYVHYLNRDYDAAEELYERALLIGSDDTVTVLRNLGLVRRAQVETDKPLAAQP